MISIGILVAWMAVGLITSINRSDLEEPRFAWAPMAMIFGPLWAAVKAEQQQEAVPALAHVEPLRHAPQVVQRS